MRRVPLYAFELIEILRAILAAKADGRLWLMGRRGWTVLELNGGLLSGIMSTTSVASPAWELSLAGQATTTGKRPAEAELMASFKLSPEEHTLLTKRAQGRALEAAFLLEGYMSWEPGLREPSAPTMDLDVEGALFRAASTNLAQIGESFDIEAIGRYQGERGAEFMRLSPQFERVFGPHELLSVLGTNQTMSEGLEGGDERTDALVFLLWRTAMVELRGHPRAVSLTGTSAAKGRPKPTPREALTERPRLRRKAQHTAQGLGFQVPKPSSAHDERLQNDTTEDRPDLDPLTLELIRAAAVALEADDYRVLGVELTACLSTVRRALQIAMRRLDVERFEVFNPSIEAARALRALRKRVEAAYDTLTDLSRRQRSYAEHTDKTRDSSWRLEPMFEAEGLFKAARICLAEGELIKAHDLLVDARQCFAHDPEHEAYLTLVDYQLNLHDGRQSAASAITRLEALVEREPNLECAWQFLGEIYASHGRDQSAVHAYQRALQINPDNDKVSSLWHSIDGAERRLRSRIISPLADRLGELGLRP